MRGGPRQAARIGGDALAGGGDLLGGAACAATDSKHTRTSDGAKGFIECNSLGALETRLLWLFRQQSRSWPLWPDEQVGAMRHLSKQLFQRDRQRADPFARRVVGGVRDGPCGAGDADLADALHARGIDVRIGRAS